LRNPPLRTIEELEMGPPSQDATPRGRTVAVVQPQLPHYRVPFFEKLRGRLEDHGVRLRLFHGRPAGAEDERYRRAGLLAELPWAEPFRARRLPLGLVWQPVLREVWKSDLVVVEGASRALLNYLLHFGRRAGGPRLAVWGHGWNHQATRPGGASERVKLWLGRRSDLYLAYTARVRQRLVELGYDPERVSDVQNTVEAPGAPPTPAELAALREELGLRGGERIALFCGRMYPDKRLGLLIEAAARAHARLPALVLLLAGAGPDEGLARDAARRHAFARYLGPLSGRRKAAAFALARCQVVPGLLGLAGVDAFHAGLPLLTVRDAPHSPEIAYLRPGENGLLVAGTPEALASALVELASDDALHARLAAGARATSAALGLDEMVVRFSAAILRTLERGRRRAPAGADRRSTPRPRAAAPTPALRGDPHVEESRAP
jgi:glycosyltransferase involved in cell wall biosynthesis